MNIDEILEEWNKDAKLDDAALDSEALRIPLLHGKYYSFYVKEKMKLHTLKEQRKKLLLEKHDYYRGIMSREEVLARGWEIWNITVLKGELPTYIDADTHVIEMNMKIALSQEKCDMLEAMIKSISNRGYQIKTAVDFIKFREGG